MTTRRNVAAQAQSIGDTETYRSLQAGILGTGSALPKRAVSNSDLETLVDTTDQWIMERVGVQTRHIADATESTASLAHLACARALDSAGFAADEIDLLIVATVTPDQALPSASALVQQQLGCTNAMAFDIQAACTGFLFALSTADALQNTHGFNNALVVGSETLSRIVDWTDRSTCVLFGDGAGAVLYSRDKSTLTGEGLPGEGKPTTKGIIAVDLHTNGSQSDFIARPGGAFPLSNLPESLGLPLNDVASPYVQMKGREVFKAGITSMCSSIEAVLAKANTSIDEIALFIPHQSNRRMVDAVCDKIKLNDPSKLMLNIDRVGNTSAASIPLALDEAARSDRLQSGDLVLMTAVGAGITYGSVLLRW